MSFDPWSHSPDLARLIEQRYELEFTGDGHLLVHNVPYLDEHGTIQRGTLATSVMLNGDVTVNPVDDHVGFWVGQVPYRWNGERVAPLVEVNHPIEGQPSENFQMSLKCAWAEKYPDYYDKVKAHVDNIAAEAQRVDPTVTAETGGPCIINDQQWPFEYADSSSGRAGLGAINERLTGQSIAIVGLGGTGSYILDLVAKCPVSEIHLFDSDKFSNHNAFRAPGAASLEEVRTGQRKVERFAEIYSRMKRKIIPHPYDITGGNVNELAPFDFIFLAMEGGPTKLAIVKELERFNKPFVNASMGIKRRPGDGDGVLAHVEVNGSTVDDRETFRQTVDFGEVDPDDIYTENIQIAELNSFNAAMAVFWWKKWSGVYVSSKPCHWMMFDTYLDGWHTDRAADV